MGYIVRSRPRDEQRKRVYAAERQSKAFLRDPLPTISEMQQFVDSILKSRYMQTLFTSRVLAPITVLSGRRLIQRHFAACVTSGESVESCH